jgi:hypothetical protein
MWLEFQEINLGSWASKSLREIATEAGVKEAYDQHYSILSVASHAQWIAVREEGFPPFKQRFRAYKFIKPRESTEVASSTEEAAKS